MTRSGDDGRLGDDAVVRYVVTGWVDELQGYAFDPRRYLEVLPGLIGSLPPGARDFIAEETHYDFTSDRCVKDLVLGRVILRGGDATVVFDGSPWKHREGLTLDYSGVQSFDYDLATAREDYYGNPAMMLDEILPLDEGFSHEMALGTGDLKIVARELTFSWRSPKA